jgi:hypothetical protein
MRTLAISAFMLLGAAAPSFAQSAYCNVPEFSTFAGQQVTGRMEVKAGYRCTVGMVNSAGPTRATLILARPAHGTLSLNGMQVIYTPKPGYVGSDSFMYTRGFNSDPNHPSQRRVLMKVSVNS